MNERSRRFLEVQNGTLTLQAASDALGLSQRQAQRLWHRYLSEGPAGLRHRSCGRPSNRAYANALKDKVRKLHLTTCRGLGPTQLASRLAQDAIHIHHETLRRWLVSWNGWEVHRRPGCPGDAGNATKGFGLFLVFFSIWDRWCGSRRPPCWLHVLADEAVGTLLLALGDAPGDECALAMLRTWIQRYGIPAGIRCRTSLLRSRRSPTIAQQLNGESNETVFARALERLGIEAIPLSPAAESCHVRRREPVFGEVRAALADSTSARQATALLQGVLGRSLNQCFAGNPLDFVDYHVPVADDADLRGVFQPCARPAPADAASAPREGRRLLRLVAV